jgi:hypothetical protein
MKRRPPSRPIPPYAPTSEHLSDPNTSRSPWIQRVVSPISKRPWLLWGTAWVVTIAVATVAFALLSNPLFVEQPNPPTGPRATAPVRRDPPSPFWSIGMIVLASAMGSILIARSDKP